MRDWQKDWETSQAAPSKPWRAVRISTRGTTPLGDHDTYATVLDAENISLIDECWGDGERVYFCYLKPSVARFIAEASEALPYWLERVKELESALRLAYQALTDGMVDIPPEKRSLKCSKLRTEAKRNIRQVLRIQEGAV